MSAAPQFALRPFLAEDASTVVQIFQAAIAELTSDDYSEAQQEAWASVADDVGDFAAKLGGQLTLVATLDGEPVGFASLAGKDKIDMLYVHPDAAGQGAGATLADALEKLAAARGAEKLTVDSSDTARPWMTLVPCPVSEALAIERTGR